MGSKSSNKEKLYSYDESQAVEAIPEPDPTPTDVSDNASTSLVKGKERDKKGRSWSLVSRSGGDSTRTQLSKNAKLGG